MSSTLKQAILSLKSRIADAYTAIAAKGGAMPATQDSANLPTAIASIPSAGGGSRWTGHVDEAGLRSIGWDDNDIDALKSHICWMSDDDSMYSVPQELIDLYNQNGNDWDDTATRSHMAQWYFRYMPKYSSKYLAADVESTYLYATQADFNRLGTVYSFTNCLNLLYFYSDVIWGAVVRNTVTFRNCARMQDMKFGETSGKIIITNAYGWALFSVNTMYNISNVSQIIDLSRCTQGSIDVGAARNLSTIYIWGLKYSVGFGNNILFSKDSLLYMIQNEAATSAITITIASVRYATLSTDADILSALQNHPYVTLASA